MAKITVFAKNLALVGVLGGVAIAVGVPMLTYMGVAGGVMSQGGAIAITIIAILAGAPIVLVSAFFGIVIPQTVEKSDSGEKKGDKGNKAPVDSQWTDEERK